MFKDVAEFQKKFGHEYDGPPRELTYEEYSFKCDHLEEELVEFKEGWITSDLAAMLDALIDLIYVALGIAYIQGFPFEEGWKRVHEANMKKVRASSAEESKRGSQLDIAKPEGWEPPQLQEILDEARQNHIS